MSNAAPKLDVAEDRTVYPIEDDMGEGSLQRFISELLRMLIERWLESQGKATFVGADQYFYWEQYNPRECVAPDVYVLPGVAPGTAMGAWKVWETGCVPSFALEVVSQDVDKDYLASPARYERLGAEELVVFDPDYTLSPTRYRFQVFRKSKRGLIRVEATNADRVKSKVLGCHLRAVGVGDNRRVRIGTGLNGETLFPTDAEAREQAEADREQAEAAREQAEAAAQEQRAGRERAEAGREQAEAGREQAEAGREQAEATTRDLAAQLDAERSARAQLEAELARLCGAPKPPSSRGRASKRK
jgi:Uma2 family endonuclease